MQTAVRQHFQQLLHINCPDSKPITLTAVAAARLIDRIDNIRLHAHSYSLLHNLTYGSLKPVDILNFAFEHELHGINIHVDDGGEHSLSHSHAEALARFKQRAERLNLAIHLETSHTGREEINRVVRIAQALGVQNIRAYPRYEGQLTDVMAQVVADLRTMGELADKHDLYFDIEQHETLKSTEIVHMLLAVNHPRLHVLFDFTNMINAYERPLPALRTLAPYIRQVHLKGAKTIREGNGYGRLGVVQSSAEDETPYGRMLYELLMLGEAKPQVICFALEQEVNYYAPAYRRADEGRNPYLPYKEPSDTPFNDANPGMSLLKERRWAANQVHFIKSLLAELRWLAQSLCENGQQTND